MRASWLAFICGGLLLGTAAVASAQASMPSAPSRDEAQPREPPVSVTRDSPRRGGELRDEVAKTAPLSPGSVRINRARVPATAANDGPSHAQPRITREETPAANKRIALALEGSGTDDGALKLIGGGGQLASGGTVEIPRQGVAVVASIASKQIAARSKLTTSEKTPLPWMVLDDDPAAPREKADVRATRPFLQLAAPIHWDEARRLHVAAFWFGLDVEQGEPGPLARPIDVLFSVTCGEISPQGRVQIAESGVAGYARISVGCSPSDKNADAPERLSLRLDDGQLDYPFEIPRLAGPPQLFASTKRAEGLGLSTIDLTVSHAEEDGTSMPVTADLPVTLTTESGALDVTQLVIPKGAAEASVSVRPRGIGRLSVTARIGSEASPSVAIDLGWPTLASIAALLGGGLGGLLAARNKRRRRMRSRVVEGALVGLVVTALCLVMPDFSALGVYLRTTEVALFALSAIAGFAGSHLIDRAARVLFPSLRQDNEATKSHPDPAPTRR